MAAAAALRLVSSLVLAPFSREAAADARVVPPPAPPGRTAREGGDAAGARRAEAMHAAALAAAWGDTLALAHVWSVHARAAAQRETAGLAMAAALAAHPRAPPLLLRLSPPSRAALGLREVQQLPGTPRAVTSPQLRLCRTRLPCMRAGCALELSRIRTPLDQSSSVRMGGSRV